MALREKQMAERRARIVDAAAELIRETGGTHFSMLSLAERAEVSPATPYNLFRSKSGLLYALLYRSLDDIVRGGLELSAKDPIARVLEAGELAAAAFTRDPGFLRPLYQFLLGVRDDEHRPRFMRRSLDYWRTALAAAERAGMLRGAVDRDQLAWELAVHFLGSLDVWIHGERDDRGFRAQIAYGTALLCFAIADEPGREQLRARLRAARRRLPRTFPFERDRGAALVLPIPQPKRARARR